MKILVTGCEGFLGQHVVRIAEKRGHEVFHFDIKHKMELLQRFPFDFKPYDVVIHLAAHIDITESIEKPWLYVENNIRALKVFGEVKRIVFASSAAVYGGFSPYGYTKRLGESLLIDNSISLRMFNPFGPGENHKIENHIVPLLADNSISGNKTKLFHKGEQVRDFIHVEDAARAFVLAAESESTGTFDLCHTPLKIKDVARIMDVDYELVESPRDNADTTVLVGNNSELRKAIGWVPLKKVEKELESWRNWRS